MLIPQRSAFPSIGATSSQAGGVLSSSLSAEEHISAGDQLALTDEEVLAPADLGIYSDFYRVGFVPTPAR